MDRLPPESLTIRELIEYLREMLVSQKGMDRLCVIWIHALLDERLTQCTDREIAELLDMVQQRLGVFAPEVAIVEHARRRLLKSAKAQTVNNQC